MEKLQDRTRGFWVFLTQRFPFKLHQMPPPRLLQQESQCMVPSYSPSPICSLPFIVFTCLKDLQDGHCAQCPSTWLCTRLSCDATQVFSGLQEQYRGDIVFSLHPKENGEHTGLINTTTGLFNFDFTWSRWCLLGSPQTNASFTPLQ